MNTLRVLDGLEQSNDDIRRKFEGTYFEARIPRYTGVVWFRGFDDEGEHVRLNTRSGGGLVVLDANEVEILRDFPQVGWVNYERNALLIRRNPARQWACGMTRANSLLTLGASFTTVQPSFAVALAAFGDQQPHSIKEALKSIRDGKLEGVALNRDYAILNTTEGITLFRKKVPLAVFESNKFFFNSACTCFKPELETDFKGEYREFFKT